MQLLPRPLALALIVCMGWLAASTAIAGHIGVPTLTFGVISQRSAVMTAHYWNPILRHLSEQSGVSIKLRLARTSLELASMIRRGELDLIYSNYQYAPGNDTERYTVIARPMAGTISSQIIVPAESSITALDQLQGQQVAFSSPVSFTGYHLPIDALLRSGIRIKTQFAGTLEGALGRMLSGRAAAAGVNAAIAKAYAERQHIAYRVLWSSAEYPAIPIAAHSALPKDQVESVRAALLTMADTPKGRQILAASASLFGNPRALGFTAASESEYDQLRYFYRHRLSPQEMP